MPAPRPVGAGQAPLTKSIGKGDTSTYNMKGDTPDDNVGPVFDTFAQDDVEAYNPNQNNFNLGGDAGYANRRAAGLATAGNQATFDQRQSGQQGLAAGQQAAAGYNAKGGAGAEQGYNLMNRYASQGQEGNAMQQARALGFGGQGTQGLTQGVTRAGTQQGQASNISNQAYNQGNTFADRSQLAGARSGVGVTNGYQNDQNRQLEGQARGSQLGAAQALGMRASDGSGQANTQGLRNFAAQTGSGPSVAQSQMQAGSEASMASALAMARSGRGNNTQAGRQAMFQNAATQQQTNQQLGTLRAQEYDQAQQRQLGALSAESSALQNYRGQDLQALQAQASALGQARQQDQGQQQLGIGQGQFDATLGLQNRQLNDQTSLAWAQQQQAAAQRGDAAYFQGQQLGNQSIQQGQQYNLGMQQLGQQASQAGQQYDLSKGQLGQQALQQGQQFQLGMGGLANQANAQGQSYNAQMQGLGNQYTLGMQGLAGQTMAQQLGADMGYEQLRSQNFMQAQQANAQLDAQRDASNAKMMEGALGAFGKMMMLSDRRSKKDVEPVGDDALQLAPLAGFEGLLGGYAAGMSGEQYNGGSFLNSVADSYESPKRTASHGSSREFANVMSDERSKGEISSLKGELAEAYAALGGPPRGARFDRDALDEAYERQGGRVNRGTDLSDVQGYTYRYKQPGAFGAAAGRHVGPMAQDLERNPATAGAVVTGRDGMKRVDGGRLALVNTAAIADTQREVKQLRAEALATNGGRYPALRQPDTDALDAAYSREGGTPRRAEALGYDRDALDAAYEARGGRVNRPWRELDPLDARYANTSWRYQPGF